MKYLNKFDTTSDYQASAATLEIPNVAYITATTEVIYNGTAPTPPTPSQYVEFDDPLVESKCATLYGDGTGCTMADLSAVTAISASDWSGTNITSFDELQYFSGLTEIPESLFEQCGSLSSVTMPSTITDIGDYAFDSCSSLTSITIPNSVTVIGYQPFYGCTDMTSAVIGNSLTSISEGFFEGCTGLTSVTLGSSVQEIHTNSFFECTSLSAITIPEYVDFIESESFSGCSSLSSITFVSDTPPLVDSDAFSELSVTGDITVPVGSERDYSEIARNIGPDWTVNGQPPLEPYVEFEDPLVEERCIQLYSSDGVGCTESDLGEVTSIGGLQLNGTDITSFNELGMFTGVTTIPTMTFSQCSALTEVTLPSSVTNIQSHAFYNCTSLEGVGLDGVSLEYIYGSVFYGCSSLQSITFPDTLALIDTEAFRNCSSLSDITFIGSNPPATIESNAFRGLPSTGNITVPDGDESNFYSLAQSLGNDWTVNEQTPS